MGASWWGARRGPGFSRGAAAQVCGPLQGRSRVGSALRSGNSAASAVIPAREEPGGVSPLLGELSCLCGGPHCLTCGLSWCWYFFSRGRAGLSKGW